MKNFLWGFGYAARGLGAGWRGQVNFKVMVALAAAAVALGWYRGIGCLEWSAVILSIGLVLALELVNTAGEALVDILSPGFDPRYGRIKDLLAGSVLIASIAAGAVGVLVLVF